MSITIHHLEDRFTNQDRVFPASFDEIVFGLSDQCDVVYAAESGDVAPKHLRLTRSESGTLKAEALGRTGVDIDGKWISKEDGPVEIDYGSVIRLGKDGPSFKVWNLTLTVHHLDGPLKGKTQKFDNSREVITFGRAPDSDVVFPPACDKVGRHHFLFRRNWFGSYDIEFSEDHFVSVNDWPLRYGFNRQIRSGSVLRLGSRDGPSFKVQWDDARNSAGPAVTGPNDYIAGAAKALERNKRLVAASLVAIFLVALGLGGYLVYRETRLMTAFDSLKHNVYVVVKKDGGVNKAVGTAFLIGNDVLATNAHVTQAMHGAEGQYYLLGPNDKGPIEIVSVESHPGYALFEGEKHTFGTRRYMSFEPADLPSGYDVGLIHVEPISETYRPLELASWDELEALDEGTEIASAGFPQEGLKGVVTAAKSPVVKVVDGIIRGVADVFQGATDDVDERLIILHDIPVAGGASGSPIVDVWSGKVIAIVSGGNIVPLKVGEEDEAFNSSGRTSSAALVNFAHRIDLIDELLNKTAFKELAKHEDYWERMAKDRAYDRHFALVKDLFMSEGKMLYGGQPADEFGWAEGTLVPGKDPTAGTWKPSSSQPTGEPVERSGEVVGYTQVTDVYDFEAEPGLAYGFLLETDGMPIDVDPSNAYADVVRIRIAPNDKLLPKPEGGISGSNPHLALAVWASVSEPTTLQIKVSGSLERPSHYTVYVYRWTLPSADPAGVAPVAGSLSP